MYTLYERQGKKIALVDMTSERNKLFSDILDKTLKKYIKLGKKILFVSNRKGYASSLLCQECGYIPKCKHCDIPIAKYKVEDKFVFMCPICRRVYSDIVKCENCGSFSVKEIGIGTQKLAEILEENYFIQPFVVENNQINSLNKVKNIEKVLSNQKYVISTAIFSFPSDLFIPDIIVFVNADVGLLLPDFNVNEKHFFFVYEFLKNYPTKNYIIQTFNSNHFVYLNAINFDINGFWKEELKFRKMLNYPPYTEMALLHYKSEVEEKLYNKISKLERELKYFEEKLNMQIEIYPTPALVFKKFGKFHYNIILKGKNLRTFLDIIVKELKLQQKGFQIDWLPISLIS